MAKRLDVREIRGRFLPRQGDRNWLPRRKGGRVGAARLAALASRSPDRDRPGRSGGRSGAVLGAVLSAGPDRPTPTRSKPLHTGRFGARAELATWWWKAVIRRRCRGGGYRRELDVPPESS